MNLLLNLQEFDHPFTLLERSDSLLSQLAKHTGKTSSEKLKQIARLHFQKRELVSNIKWAIISIIDAFFLLCILNKFAFQIFYPWRWQECSVESLGNKFDFFLQSCHSRIPLETKLYFFGLINLVYIRIIIITFITIICYRSIIQLILYILIYKYITIVISMQIMGTT